MLIFQEINSSTMYCLSTFSVVCTGNASQVVRHSIAWRKTTTTSLVHHTSQTKLWKQATHWKIEVRGIVNQVQGYGGVGLETSRNLPVYCEVKHQPAQQQKKLQRLNVHLNSSDLHAWAHTHLLPYTGMSWGEHNAQFIVRQFLVYTTTLIRVTWNPMAMECRLLHLTGIGHYRSLKYLVCG